MIRHEHKVPPLRYYITQTSKRWQEKIGQFYESSFAGFHHTLWGFNIEMLNFVSLSQSSMKRNTVRDSKVVIFISFTQIIISQIFFLSFSFFLYLSFSMFSYLFLSLSLIFYVFISVSFSVSHFLRFHFSDLGQQNVFGQLISHLPWKLSLIKGWAEINQI